MEAVDWENSSGGSSDTEAYLQDTKYEDDEELHFTSGFISKLQFRKDKSRAPWINEIGMAEVVENKGKLWRTMGVVRSGKIYYSIEETLFLMEIGALVLLDDNDSWELFEVYRHLKLLGYIVGQHGITWSIKDAKSNRQSVSLQCSPQSSELVDLESEDESSIVGPFNNMHINEARPVFDVYLPNSNFVICLTRQCGAIPLRFCHVEYGRVSFFSFDEVELPILP
ncbi:hypothetical protein ACJW30_09G168200 [Castanea mollissima]